MGKGIGAPFGDVAERPGVKLIIYNTAFSACEKTKPLQKTLVLIEEMQQKGLAALSLMRRQGLQHITITYNFLISACRKSMITVRALLLSVLMRLQGIQNVVTYSAPSVHAERVG